MSQALVAKLAESLGPSQTLVRVSSSVTGEVCTSSSESTCWWCTIVTSGIWIIYYIINESGLVARYMPTDGSWG